MELVLDLLDQSGEGLFGYLLHTEFLACQIMPDMDPKQLDPRLLLELPNQIQLLLLNLLILADHLLQLRLKFLEFSLANRRDAFINQLLNFGVHVVWIGNFFIAISYGSDLAEQAFDLYRTVVFD